MDASVVRFRPKFFPTSISHRAFVHIYGGTLSMGQATVVHHRDAQHQTPRRRAQGGCVHLYATLFVKPVESLLLPDAVTLTILLTFTPPALVVTQSPHLAKADRGRGITVNDSIMKTYCGT